MPTPNGGGLPHDNAYLFSCTDQPWDERRSAAEDVRTILEAHGLEEWARRIGRCAEFLHFTRADGELSLLEAHFCRVRMCPVCQWRRALMLRAKLYEALPKIREAFPTSRLLFLTLTVRNVPVDRLGQTLDEMAEAWHRFSARAEFRRSVIGWLRTTEVTRNADNNTAHPHYHCLLLVKASYFGAGYIKRERWKQLWQEAMRLDYQPVVDIRAVKCEAGIVPEIAKYSVKPTKLGAEDADEWLIIAARQMHKRQFVAAGGVLRQAFRYLQDVRELEALEAGEPPERKPDLTFAWRRVERRYRRRQPRGSASSEGGVQGGVADE